MPELIWAKIVIRLKGICDDEFRLKRCCLRYKLNQPVFESTIVSVLPEPLKRFERNGWALLYRGKRDGFKASQFHEKCDGKKDTVTLILTTKAFIFGGFTPIAWDSNNAFLEDDSEQSFLFSIKNPQDSEPVFFHS
jgi:hypothetical protein